MQRQWTKRILRNNHFYRSVLTILNAGSDSPGSSPQLAATDSLSCFRFSSLLPRRLWRSIDAECSRSACSGATSHWLVLLESERVMSFEWGCAGSLLKLASDDRVACNVWTCVACENKNANHIFWMTRTCWSTDLWGGIQETIHDDAHWLPNLPRQDLKRRKNESLNTRYYDLVGTTCANLKNWVL